MLAWMCLEGKACPQLYPGPHGGQPRAAHWELRAWTMEVSAPAPSGRNQHRATQPPCCPMRVVVSISHVYCPPLRETLGIMGWNWGSESSALSFL